MIELEIPVIRASNGKGWEWLSSNRRYPHPAVKWKLSREYRNLGRAIAQTNKLPRMERAHVTAIIHRTTRRRFDPNNLAGHLKPIIDGMVVDYGGWLPDDDHHHLIGPDMRAGEPRKVPCITLQIEELPAA